MTVLEVIQLSTDFLAKKGVDAPRLQTELLLAHLLELPRMQLYLNFDRSLNSSELEAMRERIKRRGQREPLQHILGSTSFCGLEIAVNPHVLIPRPETELLAERGWQFLNQRSTGASRLVSNSTLRQPVSPHPGPLPQGEGERSAVVGMIKGTGLPNERPAILPLPKGEGRGEGEASIEYSGAAGNEGLLPPTALDVGTGSGCLAIALAVKCPSAQVYAVDISEEAVVLASQNASRCGVTDRIHFLRGDLFAPLPEGIHFDLIISNPPYIRTAEIDSLQPEVRDHDPRQALNGGADGLDYFRHLAAGAGPLLKTGGKIMLEFGDGQAEPIRDIFKEQMWVVEAIEHDYTQRPRIFIASRA